MHTYRFTVTVDGIDVMAAAAQDALYEAGCSDATIGVVDGVQTIDFDRHAPTFGDAVGSAIRSIENGVAGTLVVAVHRAREA